MHARSSSRWGQRKISFGQGFNLAIVGNGELWMSIRAWAWCIWSGVVWAACVSEAAAQAPAPGYPAKTVRIVVAYPGGVNAGLRWPRPADAIGGPRGPQAPGAECL